MELGQLGLGVWTVATRRYYPMERIRERGRALIDQLDGRKVLIYIDPETNTPAALFVSALLGKMQDDEIHLDNGAAVRDGVLFDRRGKRVTVELPGCEIFGG